MKRSANQLRPEREKYFRPLVSVSGRMHQVGPDKKQAVFQLAISSRRDAHSLCWSMNALGVHLELMLCSSYSCSTLHCVLLINTLFFVLYVHGSVHRESNLITVQKDATYSVYYISVGSSTCFGC